MSKLKKEREVEVKDTGAEGLKDGGHVLLACSNCNALLVDLWRTRPHEKNVWKVQATCCFCGDKSFVGEIQGGFHNGGYGTVKDDDADDDVPSTVIDHFETVEVNGEDVFLFHTKKASPDAKPVRQRF